MDYDFPETVGNVIIPTDDIIFFRGVETNQQPVLIIVSYHDLFRYFMISEHISTLFNILVMGISAEMER